MQPGDIFVVQSRHPFDRLIRWAQGKTYVPRFSKYSHCGVVIDEAGTTAEALWTGISYGSLRNYPEHVIIPIESAYDRRMILHWATMHIGIKYGFATIASIVLTLLTRTKWKFERSGAMICSGYVGSALMYSGHYIQDDPQWVMPAAIAKWADVP